MVSTLHTHVLVIGGGIVGCATAYAVAKAGHRVTLIEQFKVGHAFGSSHGPSRIIRLAYDGADYVRMAQASYAAWRMLEAEANVSLLEVIGGYDIGVPGTEAIAGIRNTFVQTGVPFEEMTGTQLMARFPQMHISENMEVLYQADYGLLHADACVSAFTEQAKFHGATIVEDERVTGIHPSTTQIEVQTTHQRYSADRIIICAGLWMNKVLEPLALHLPLMTTKEMKRGPIVRATHRISCPVASHSFCNVILAAQLSAMRSPFSAARMSRSSSIATAWRLTPTTLISVPTRPHSQT